MLNISFWLLVDGSQLIDINSLRDEVLVGLQWVVASTVLPVRWAVVLLEVRVLLAFFEVGTHKALEVSLREEAVGWAPVIQGSWLVVPKVRHADHVRVGKQQRHVRVAIVDAVQLLAVQELSQVVLYNWVLGDSSVLGSSGLTGNTVTKGEDVLKSLVLQGVRVHIDEASGISDTSLNQFRMRLRVRVDTSMGEDVFHGLAGVYILHDGDLLSDVVLVSLDHLPAKMNVNSSLMALL